MLLSLNPGLVFYRFCPRGALSKLGDDGPGGFLKDKYQKPLATIVVSLKSQKNNCVIEVM